MQQQQREGREQPFLREGDWVQFTNENLTLFAEGFRSGEVAIGQPPSPLHSVFQLTLAVDGSPSVRKHLHFHQPLLLHHRLSGKYLAFNADFASRSEFRLRSQPSPHCHFSLRPLFKCQTLKGSLLRNGQSCSLGLTNPSSTEQLFLAISRYDPNSQEAVSVSLRKNDKAALKITRMNGLNLAQRSIRTLEIYQLKHVESQRWLGCSHIWEVGRFFVEFTPTRNDSATLLTLILPNRQPQTRLSSAHQIAFAFAGSKKHLSFDSQGEVYLSARAGEESQFQLELYGDCEGQLELGSLIKVNHIKSGLYLSMKGNTPVLTQFTPFNVFQFGVQPAEQMRLSLFAHQTLLGLQREFQEGLHFPHRREAASALTELVKYIYRSRNVYKQFSQLQPLRPLLTHQQQLLFAQAGFLPLLRKLALHLHQFLLQTASARDGSLEQRQGELGQDEMLLMQVMLVVVGICKGNAVNLTRFSEDIKAYFELIGKVSGSVELLYHLFAHSNAGLQVLEGLEFIIKKYHIRALELLTEFLFGKQFSLQDRIKIVKLLHGCVINQRGEKMRTHQQILTSVFLQSRLRNVFLSLSTNSDLQLLVTVAGQREQLSQLLLRQETFPLQVRLLYSQLDLLTSLCAGGNLKHLVLFRDTLSEEMLQKYLKRELNPPFKSLLLRVLTSIYLNQDTEVRPAMVLTNPKKKGFSAKQPFRQISDLSVLSGRLLDKSPQNQEVQMEEVHENRLKIMTDFRSLIQIKELIRTLIRTKIGKGQVGEELIAGVAAMKKFQQLGASEENESEELLKQLMVFLVKDFQKKILREDLVAQFLLLLEYNIQAKLQYFTTVILLKVREHFRQSDNKAKRCQGVIHIFNTFVSTHLQPICQQRILQTLTAIIPRAVASKNYPLLSGSCQLLRKLHLLPTLLLKLLKRCVPIQSDLSHQILRRANKLHNAIRSHVRDYVYFHQNSPEQTRLRLTIQHLLQQANDLLADQDELRPNLLAQRALAEFGFLEDVSELIVQRQRDLQNPENNELFKQLFRFVGLFLKESEENYLRGENSVRRLGAIFRFIDRGQLRLLAQLTQTRLAVEKDSRFLLDCWLLSIRHSFAAKPPSPLGLLLLLRLPNNANLSYMATLLVSDETLLSCLLKTTPQNAGELSLTHNRTCESSTEWLLYLILVLRLLVVIAEQAQQSKGDLLDKLRQYLTLSTLVRLLEESFVLEFDSSPQSLLYDSLLKLAKRHLMDLFSLLYLPKLGDFQAVALFIQKIGGRMLLKNIRDDPSESLCRHLTYPSHTQDQGQRQLRQVMSVYLQMQTDRPTLSSDCLAIYVHNLLLFLTLYFPFLFQLCQHLIDQGGQQQQRLARKKEAQLLKESLLKKMREIVQEKLGYAEFVAHHLNYTHALKEVEEITKQRIEVGFNHQPAEDDAPVLLQGQEYFRSPSVVFLLDSYASNSNRIEKYLYESLLVLTLHPNVTRYMPERNISLGRPREVYSLILQQLKQREAENSLQQDCQMMAFFLDNCALPVEIQPTLEYEQILGRVNEDDIDEKALKNFLETESKLLESYFSLKGTASKRYEKLDFPSCQQFQLQFTKLKTRLAKILSKQAQLHNEKRLIQQAELYGQGWSLNSEQGEPCLRIEFILHWLLLKVSYNFANVERYFDLLLQVVGLLQSYVKFIGQFQRRYLPSQLQEKLQCCFNILFKSATGSNLRMQLVLIEHEIWNELNLILALDDSLKRNQDELNLSTYDLLKLLTRSRLLPPAHAYIQGVLQLYSNSLAVYGQAGETLGSRNLPLVPVPAFYRNLKQMATMLVKQFRYLPDTIAAQFFSKLDVKTLDYNISCTYQKYLSLFQSYSIAVLHTHLAYSNSSLSPIAHNMAIENAIQLTSLKLYIQALNGNYQLLNRANKMQVDAHNRRKIKSFFGTLAQFFTDFFLLFFRVCLSLFKGRRQEEQSAAVQFFLGRLGRVQLIFRGKLYEYQFMVYPECVATGRMKDEFLLSVNFLSNQLKRQSILLSMQRYLLHYSNTLQFYQRFSGCSLMLFLAKHVQILKLLSYLIVITNNLLLLTDQIQTLNFATFSITHPFEVLTVLNLIDSLFILAVFFIKDAPLILRIYSYDLSQGLGYFGRNYSEKSAAQRRILLALQLLFDPRLLYNVIYTVIVGLIFWHKLFASILLLDVLAHIPSLNTLLLSIWRPRFQIILTILAYIILQYFFSILMYFLFRKEAFNNCDSLGECFSFIFYVTFKTVHGFVGYIFQQNSGKLNISISLFQIFEDIYVIIIYQVMVALILAIVIDSFTVARAEKLKQQEFLSSACIVCNLERSRFNLTSKLGFKGHKSISHNIFSYFDFKYALVNKKLLTMNDYELAVLEDSSSNWIPDGRAKELEIENSNPQIPPVTH